VVISRYPAQSILHSAPELRRFPVEDEQSVPALGGDLTASISLHSTAWHEFFD